ncbi:MAG: FxLYD domain-containing protein, partial [Christensenellaceae bacterium]|nr:FxLYD domain-containing protein [Christensenellaceae bacterium]
LLLLCTVLLLSSCGAKNSSLEELFCRHEWQNPTCTQPKTCSLCGKTAGDALGHDYEDTTCISQKPCTRCGTYDGMVLTHDWREDGKVCLLCGMDTRTSEEKFSEALTFGLFENFYTYAEARKDGFLAEYEALQPYKEEAFLDQDLAFWVTEYYKNLEEIKGVLDRYGTDEWETVYTDWLYHDRALIFYNINKLLPLTVSEECRADLQALLKDGESVNSVSLLCEEIDFHDITGSDGRQTHEALVENISLLDFKKFSLELALLDESGNTVETKTITVRNWKQGVEKSLRFSTNAKFKTIDVKYANWVTATP